jgi:hypothetical protein
MKAYDYLTEELGFVAIDVNFDRVTIGEDWDDSTDWIFINFKRQTAIKWASGYDPVTLLGKGLTKKEEEKLSKLDLKNED